MKQILIFTITGRCQWYVSGPGKMPTRITTAEKATELMELGVEVQYR